MLRMHHVGYAVHSISEYLERYVSPLFEPQTVSPIVEDPIQRVRIAFVTVPGGLLELIEPTGTDSPVQQILSRKRGGLYHVGYTTPRFDEALAQAMATGCRPLGKPVPAVAFGQRRIVFLLTPHFELIELIEMPEAATS